MKNQIKWCKDHTGFVILFFILTSAIGTFFSIDKQFSISSLKRNYQALQQENDLLKTRYNLLLEQFTNQSQESDREKIELLEKIDQLEREQK